MTKKNIRNKELYMESIKRGSLVGGIIWVCVVIFISINYKTMGKAALPWLVPMLAGHIVLGALLQLGTVKKRMINGLAALWSIIIIMFALICIAYYIPDWIRYIIVLSFFVLVVIWVGDYWYLSRMARKLNQGRSGYALCISLKEKPSSKEDFLRKFEDYCARENIRLEYEVKDVPAIVLMDGIRCEVRLDSTPGFGGAEYMMKVTEE